MEAPVFSANPPRALWALIAALLALALFVDGVAMTAAPLWWYGLIPGVAATGPFNEHFVLDIGAAYLAAALSLALAVVRLERAAALPALCFLGLHALVHLVPLQGAARLTGIFVCAPPERAGLIAEMLGVYAPALIVLALVVPARWQEAWSFPSGMLKPLIEANERRLGVKMDYVGEMAGLNWPAFVRIGKIASLTMAARPQFDVRIAHMASLAAAQVDDCGECVQIHLNLAAKDGVAREALQAALEDRPQVMEPQLALAWRFGRAVAANDPATDDIRRKIEGLIGRSGLMDLGYAVAMARFYPTLKRALGYAVACGLKRPSPP
jgi:AhpD family alkylhydroperoxidase